MSSKDEKSVIRFTGQVHQIKTLVDGGYSVTLSLGENDLKQIAKLLECKKAGALLEIAAVPVIVTIVPESKENAEKKSRKRERYPYD